MQLVATTLNCAVLEHHVQTFQVISNRNQFTLAQVGKNRDLFYHQLSRMMVALTLNIIGSRGLKRTFFPSFHGSASLGSYPLPLQMDLVHVAGIMFTDNYKFTSCLRCDPREKGNHPVSFKGKVLEKDTDWPSLGHVSILKYLPWTKR